MNKSRLGAPVALCAVVLVPTSLGCSLSTRGTTAAPDHSSSVVGGSSIPAAPATDEHSPAPRPGSRTALVEGLEEGAEAPDEEAAVTADGTDSVTTTSPPAPIDDATRDRLARFGQHYLGFDHRLSTEDRVLALEPFVTPPLLADLVAPLPAALVEELAAEQRVVTPELVSVEPLGEAGDGSLVFRLTYDVATSTMSPEGQTVTESGPVIITVVTGVDGLIEDVR